MSSSPILRENIPITGPRDYRPYHFSLSIEIEITQKHLFHLRTFFFRFCMPSFKGSAFFGYSLSDLDIQPLNNKTGEEALCIWNQTAFSTLSLRHYILIWHLLRTIEFVFVIDEPSSWATNSNNTSVASSYAIDAFCYTIIYYILCFGRV